MKSSVVPLVSSNQEKVYFSNRTLSASSGLIPIKTVLDNPSEQVVRNKCILYYQVWPGGQDSYTSLDLLINCLTKHSTNSEPQLVHGLVLSTTETSIDEFLGSKIVRMYGRVGNVRSNCCCSPRDDMFVSNRSQTFLFTIPLKSRRLTCPNNPRKSSVLPTLPKIEKEISLASCVLL